MPVRPAKHVPAASLHKRHVPQEQQRETSNQRGYTWKWTKARNGYMSRHPLCVHCEARGVIRLATDLDHIIPHKGDMDLFWQRSNWQGLCKSCHSTKTAKEDGGFGNRTRV